MDSPTPAAFFPPRWWCNILFPAGLTATDDQAEPFYRSWRAPFLVIALATLLFMSRLDAPLLEPQEARYAEIPRQMLVEGRWLVPVLHGQDYLDKPPLLYWLIMASYQVFGVHDWAARLIPGFAGIFTILIAFLWVRRMADVRAAFWAALVLCLSVRYIYLGRMIVMDGLLTLWVVLAWAMAHVALISGPQLRKGWWLLSALACGLGLLTKGPIALVLVVVPVQAFAWLERRGARISLIHWAIYLIMACGIAAPWFVATSFAVPGFAYEFFWHHHVERFVTPFDHQEPFWFYLPGLLLGSLPWILLVPGLVRWLGQRSPLAASHRPSAVGFFLLAASWPIAFFSASGCKRAVYIIPALPPLAIALGCYLNTRIPKVLPSLVSSQTPGKSKLVSVAWPVCATLTALLLCCGVEFLLPAYNRIFALRDDLEVYADQDARSPLHVICYPLRFDSVSFYLPHATVESYRVDQRDELMNRLRMQDQTLLLIKSGHTLQELLADLPSSLVFETQSSSRAAITVGWVRRRPMPLAQR